MGLMKRRKPRWAIQVDEPWRTFWAKLGSALIWLAIFTGTLALILEIESCITGQ